MGSKLRTVRLKTNPTRRQIKAAQAPLKKNPFSRKARGALHKKRQAAKRGATSAQPFYMGDEAKHYGRPKSSNPFAAGTEDHAEWNEGWDAALVATRNPRRKTSSAQSGFDFDAPRASAPAPKRRYIIRALVEYHGHLTPRYWHGSNFQKDAAGARVFESHDAAAKSLTGPVRSHATRYHRNWAALEVYPV